MGKEKSGELEGVGGVSGKVDMIKYIEYTYEFLRFYFNIWQGGVVQVPTMAKGIRSPGGGITGSCVPPETGVRS